MQQAPERDDDPAETARIEQAAWVAAMIEAESTNAPRRLARPRGRILRSLPATGGTLCAFRRQMAH